PVVSVSTPSRVEVRTMSCTSSTVKALVASFFGCTRNSSRTPFATELRPQMTGLNTVATATSGGASSSTARSGTENEMFFGTISPKTTCRNDTSTSATMNETVLMISADQPVRPKGTASR